ncbi:hypothetical protein [Persicitalea sp.]
MLAQYFSAKIDQEMDELWEEKNWSDQTIQDWKGEHLRSQNSQ